MGMGPGMPWAPRGVPGMPGQQQADAHQAQQYGYGPGAWPSGGDEVPYLSGSWDSKYAKADAIEKDLTVISEGLYHEILKQAARHVD